jgi:hypothetical protein
MAQVTVLFLLSPKMSQMRIIHALIILSIKDSTVVPHNLLPKIKFLKSSKLTRKYLVVIGQKVVVTGQNGLLFSENAIT